MIEVIATTRGFAPLNPSAMGVDGKGMTMTHPKAVIIEPGTRFMIANEKQYSKEWMQKVEQPVAAAPAAHPEPVAVANPAMDAEGRPRKSRK